MKTWIGAAVVAAVLALFGPAAMSCAAAATKVGVSAIDASKATDLSARRRTRHHHRYAHRYNYRPSYYDRPYYYRPYPYNSPAPFFLGFGFGPLW